MSARPFALPAWAATFAVVLAGASGLGLSTAPLAHADDPTTVHAVDDRALTTPGAPVTLHPLANDTTEPADQLDPSTATFGPDGQPGSVVLLDDGKGIDVSGEGSYIFNHHGGLTFTPADGFHGVTSPVRYTVAAVDGSMGSATVTVTVHTAPVGHDDLVTLAATDQPARVDVLTNDEHDTDVTIDASSLRFADGQPGVTVDSSGLSATGDTGSYAIGNGRISFTPTGSASGAVTPVTYQATDSDGRVVSAAVRPTVLAVPRWTINAVTAAAGSPKTIDVLSSQLTYSDGRVPDPTRITFVPQPPESNRKVSDDGRSMTFFGGDGTASIDPVTGAVTVTGPSFVTGRMNFFLKATRENAQDATGELWVDERPRVYANNDYVNTTYTRPLTVPVLGNDSFDPAGSLDTDSVRFPQSNTEGAAVSDDGRSLTLPGVGSFVVNPTGTITFTPQDGVSARRFLGSASVTYQVSDHNGSTGSAKLYVVVSPPVEAKDDADEEGYGVTPVDLYPLSNDGGDPTLIDYSSLEFPTEGQPAGEVTDFGLGLVVPGEGRWSVLEGGDVRFVPEKGFFGTTTPVTYAVGTRYGRISAHLTVRIGAPPVAHDDSATESAGNYAVLNVLDNDAIDEAAPYKYGSMFFTADQPESQAAGDGTGKKVTVPGKGTFIARAGGNILFTPDDGFAGSVSVRYSFLDYARNTATPAVFTVHSLKRVVAADDSGSTTTTTPVTLHVTENDTTDPSQRILPSSLVLSAHQSSDGTLSNRNRTFTVPNVGTWTANVDGTMTFRAFRGFAGQASATYEVSDSFAETSAAVVSVQVLGQISTTADTPTIAWGTGTGVNVLTNDITLGSFAKDSLVFSTTGQPSGSKLASGNRQLTVPGQATYVINPSTGLIAVTPLKTVSGRALSTVRYTVGDNTGAVPATGTLTATVKAAPGLLAKADAATTKAGRGVTVQILANDHASPGSRFVASSVQLTGATTKAVRTALTNGGKKLVVAGQGTYVVNASGSITFTPAAGYTGRATSVSYKVTDGNDLSVASTLTITVSK